MRCIVNVEDAGAVVPPLPSSPFADGEVHEASSLEDSPDGSPPPSNPVASSATVPSLTASTSGTCSPSTVAHSLRTARSLPRRSLPAAVRLSVSPAPRSASPFPREATAPPPTSSSPPPLRAIASRSLPSRAPGSPAHPLDPAATAPASPQSLRAPPHAAPIAARSGPSSSACRWPHTRLPYTPPSAFSTPLLPL